jgi:hypothetical protein
VLTSSESTTGYTWSTGETTRSILAQTAGTYWVRTGTSTCYAQSSDKNVTMKSAPATPVITATGSTNLGTGGSVKLTSSSAHAYTWTTGSTQKYVTITTAGIYNVTVTGNNGCKTTSANTIVTSSTCTPPAMPAITSSSTNNILEKNSSISLKASVSGGYLWSTGETTQSITITTAGTYTVRSYNAGNCFSTSMPLTVYAADALGRDSYATADASGKISLTSYPNPAHGDFTLSFASEQEEQCTLLVYDLSGRAVLTQNISAEEGTNLIQVNAASLAPGMYVAILAGEKIGGQVRIIIE